MRNLTQKLLLLFFVLGSFGAEAKFNHSHDLLTFLSRTTSGGEKNTNMSFGLYNTLTYRASEEWTHAAILNTNFSLLSGGETNFDQNHGYIRVQSVRLGLKVLDGWSSKLRFRWQLPTGGLATQGGFGLLQTRLSFSQSWDKLSFSWQPSVTLGLVDSGYQKLTTPGGTQKGNTLAGWALELTPSYKINEDWSPYFYNSLSQSYKGGAPGQDGAMGDIGWYYEVGVGLPLGLPVSTSFAIYHSTDFNDDFTFFDMESAGAYFTFSRAF